MTEVHAKDLMKGKCDEELHEEGLWVDSTMYMVYMAIHNSIFCSSQVL